MAISAHSFASIEVLFNEAYDSNKNDDEVVNLIVGGIEDLLELHNREMINTLVLIDDFARPFMQKLDKSPLWRTLSKTAEGLIKKQLQVSIANTLAGMAVGSENSGATRYSKFKRAKKLAKYAGLIKAVPLFTAISFMSDIFDVHSNYKEALELGRKNKQANKHLKRRLGTAGERSGINNNTFIAITKIKTLLQIKTSKNRREIAYTYALSIVELLKKDQLHTGLNIYDGFTLKLINSMLTIFKIKVSVEVSVYEFGAQPNVVFRSCHFHDNSLLAMYKFLQTKDFNCFQLLLLPTMAMGSQMPLVVFVPQFPYARGSKPIFSDGNENSRTIEMVLGDNYVNNYQDYNIPNGHQFVDFRHFMRMRGWGRNHSKENRLNFTQGEKFYSETFKSMTFSGSTFTPK